MVKFVSNVDALGTVDGRNMEADGTKLDGVENNATSDLGGRSGRRQGRKRKLLVIGIGNSNWVGKASTGSLDYDNEHKPHPKVMEVSRGIQRNTYYATPTGELMQMRVPNQDNEYVKSGPKIHALKRLIELDPTIEEVAMLTGGKVSSGLVGITVDPQAEWLTDSQWMPGDTHVEDLIDEANAFLEANPDYEFGWLAGQLGPISAFSARTAAQFESDLTSAINNIRNNVKGGSNAVFTMHSMEPNMVAANYNVLTATLDGGTFPEIDAKIMELAGDTPFLSSATAIDVSDLNNGTDQLHHSVDDYTEIGKRHADAYITLRDAQEVQADFEDVRMLPSSYDGNEFRDVNGSGARIQEQVLEFDDEMGYVLRANPATNGGLPNGFQTDIQVSNSAHTIFARVKLNQNPAVLATLFGGRTPGQFNQADDPDTGVNYGRLIATTAVIYGDSKSGGVARPAFLTGWGAGMTQGQWHSLALVFDGTSFTTYLDGVLEDGPSTNGVQVLSEPGLVELLTYDNNPASGTNAVDGCITDIRVAQKAVDAATILSWHNDLPQGAADDKIRNVPTNNLLGRNSAGTGEVEALTATEAKAILAIDAVDVEYLAQESIYSGATEVGTALDNLANGLGSLATQSTVNFGQLSNNIVFGDIISANGVGITKLAKVGQGLLGNTATGSANVTTVSPADVKTMLGISASATAPASPSDGDIWYNTTEKELFTYDSGRGHWFGAPHYISMGKTTSTTAGTGHFLYVGHAGTTAVTADRGWLVPHDMTITGLRGHTQSTFDGWRFRVDKNSGGTTTDGVVSTGVLGAVDTYSDFTLDVDLAAADIIGMAGVLGSVTLNNSTFTIEVRRRL